MLQPRLDILPPPQRDLWPHLAEIPEHFVLYGGTGLALRLGHRQSVDFDFFTSENVTPAELLKSLSFLQGSKILQNTSQTLTVAVARPGQKDLVKFSFFGGLTSLGRVGEPDRTADNILTVASLPDLAGTKAAVITQRAEAKDYLDLLAIVKNGITLPDAMAAATAIYGNQYNAMMTVKSLAYFADGDVEKLTAQQKDECCKLSQSVNLRQLPIINRRSDYLGKCQTPQNKVNEGRENP
ncbi:MAG TPA: nucleotidyl transferase AbiEii/AbiGii toxin family protein [Verrucomicrobiae bacterium]